MKIKAHRTRRRGGIVEPAIVARDLADALVHPVVGVREGDAPRDGSRSGRRRRPGDAGRMIEGIVARSGMISK
jgi:hypothetical protein